MSADPKLVKDAFMIDRLSYEEAAELAYFGAQVLHARAVQPARLKGIEIIFSGYFPIKWQTQASSYCLLG